MSSKKQKLDKEQQDGMSRSSRSTKRPRAPIACFRCHHKKVRCDGIHPNCTRCLTTGVLCAYPSSRRSRTTQPTNIDPFIDNLSHLEARIRRIESDLENQRSMVQSIVVNEENNTHQDELNSKMLKTELEVQDSRSILAQLRLRGEQRISKGKRAAATAQAATLTQQVDTKEEKKKQKKQSAKINKDNQLLSINTTTYDMDQQYQHQQPFYFQNLMLEDYNSNSHGMDWTLFDTIQQQQQQSDQMILFPHQNDNSKMMMMDMVSPIRSSRSSSLTSHVYPSHIILQPSSSTTSTNTSCSSNSNESMFALNSSSTYLMDDTPVIPSHNNDVHLLSNNNSDLNSNNNSNPWY